MKNSHCVKFSDKDFLILDSYETDTLSYIRTHTLTHTSSFISVYTYTSSVVSVFPQRVDVFRSGWRSPLDEDIKRQTTGMFQHTHTHKHKYTGDFVRLALCTSRITFISQLGCDTVS